MSALTGGLVERVDRLLVVSANVVNLACDRRRKLLNSVVGGVLSIVCCDH